MWKINFNKILLFFLLYIVSFVLCGYEINLDGETCRQAPDNPPYEEACTAYNTENEACCFATIINHDKSTENKCVPVPRDARFALNHLTIFSFKDYQNNNYEDITATFKCGQKDKLCGMNSPNKIFQCSEHSSTTQSCCYLTTPTYTECILSDKKYDKETTFKLFEESTIICYSNKLKIKQINLLIYFVIIIVFVLSIL